MTRIALLLIGSAMVPTAVRAQDRQADGEHYRQTWAVVIGVNDYGKGWKPLKNAVGDARGVAEFLDQEFDIKGKNLHLLIDANGGQIRDALEKWLPEQNPQPDDAVVVFFAGHGTREGNAGYLIPSDGGEKPNDAWVPIEFVKAQLDGLKCRHKLLVLDSCFSGHLFDPLPPRQAPGQELVAGPAREPGADRGDGARGEALRRPGFFGISSGGFGPVGDGKPGDHSPFASAMLKVMMERADSARHDHAFTAAELAFRIRTEVQNDFRSDQVPRAGFLNAGDGEFVFRPSSRQRRVTPSEQRHIDEHAAKVGNAIALADETGNASSAFASLASAMKSDAAFAAGRRRGADLTVQQHRFGAYVRQAETIRHVWTHDGQRINDVEFNPNGDEILTAGDDGTARFWDARTLGQRGEPLPHPAAVLSAAFAERGGRVVTRCADGNVRVWGGDRRNPVVITDPDARIVAEQFSNDGEVLLTVGLNSARVWNAANGKPIANLSHPYVWFGAFSRDGLRVVTTGQDGTIRVWELPTGKLVGGPFDHGVPVPSADFRYDRKVLATTGEDGTIKFWNPEITGDRVARGLFAGRVNLRTRLTSAAYSADGNTMIATDTAGLLHRLTADGASFVVDDRPLLVFAALRLRERSPDWRFRVRAADGAAFLIDQATFGTPTRTISLDARAFHRADSGVGVTPEVREFDLLVTGNLAFITNDEAAISVIDVPRKLFGTQVYRWQDGDYGRTPQADWVRRSMSADRPVADSGRVAIYDPTKRSYSVVDSRTDAPVGSPFPHPAPVNTAHLSRSGTRLMTQPAEDTLQFWDVEKSPPLVATWKPTGGGSGLQFFHPEGTYAAVIKAGSDCRVFDVRAKREFSRPCVGVPVFGPDGDHIIMPILDGFEIYRLADGEHVGRIPTERFSGVLAVSGPGRCVVTASRLQTTAEVWPWPDSFPDGGEPLALKLSFTLTHTERVLAAAVSADGRFIATGSRDKTASVWDAKTGDAVSPRMWHRDRVYAVAFGPDSRNLRLATASADAHLRLWDLRPDSAYPDRLVALAELHNGTREVGGPIAADDRVWGFRRLKRVPQFDREWFQVEPLRARDWHRQAAADAEEAKNWQAAAANYAQLITLEPGRREEWYFRRADALRLQSGIEEVQGHFDQADARNWDAAEDLGNLTALDPDYAEGRVSLGEAFNRLREWPTAAKEFGAVIGLLVAEEDRHAAHGFVAGAGVMHSAKRDRRLNNLLSARLGLGNAYASQSLWKEASAEYLAAFGVTNDSPVTLSAARHQSTLRQLVYAAAAAGQFNIARSALRINTGYLSGGKAQSNREAITADTLRMFAVANVVLPKEETGALYGPEVMSSFFFQRETPQLALAVGMMFGLAPFDPKNRASEDTIYARLSAHDAQFAGTDRVIARMLLAMHHHKAGDKDKATEWHSKAIEMLPPPGIERARWDQRHEYLRFRTLFDRTFPNPK